MISKDPLWYKDAIVYELHVRSFFDSNDDGIGDFKGLIEKLDYLQDLGINTIWLLPFFKSPLKDDGYDIADYFELNPIYGQMKDFKRFIREAKKRGIRTIIELVVNHTSDQHVWFQDAIKRGTRSPYWNYYVWSDDPKKFKDTRIIFKDIENSNWTWQNDVKKYYWHRFFSSQPDLNHNNPMVVRKINKMIKFWADMGVDGFRLDAIPYLCVKEGTSNENIPETHQVIKNWRSYLDSKFEDKIFLAEANQMPDEVVEYFGSKQEPECHMAYHFPLMPRIFIAVKKEDRTPIVESLEKTPEIREDCQWGIFLRNHDELTLEMVSDEERDFMYDMYAEDKRARLNLGIRRRLAPLVRNNRKKLEMLNSLLFSMPGTPFVYYGDEIGMGDNIYLGDRNGVRTPMQWTMDRNAGFSKANPQQLFLPANMDPIYGLQAVNVERQQSQPHSLLNFMKKLITARKKYKAFGRGTIKFLYPRNKRILAYIRSYEEENILCIVNLSSSAEFVGIDLTEHEGQRLYDVFSGKKFPFVKEKDYLFTMQPQSFFWFEIKD